MTNKELVDLFISPLSECIKYKPHFGDSEKKDGYTLSEFLKLYRKDPFYSWIGVDSPYMYTAHKAAGCMTSVYRQLGIGCERLFRQILFQQTGYNDFLSAEWSYSTITRSGNPKTLSLDGRLELKDINKTVVKKNAEKWIHSYADELEIDGANLKGAVFEVRQGYKSKDSKRQNGDLDNATVAYSKGYFPVFTIFSSQIDADIALRYKNSKCGILIGNIKGSSTTSLYKFCNDVLLFDLAYFFEKNSPTIKRNVNKVLQALFENK